MKKLVLLICLAGLSLPLAAQPEVQFDVIHANAAYLGVRLRDVNEQDVARLGLPSETGALITEVVADSPAAQAGLLEDDVIVGVSGLPILSAAQLQRTIRENPAGRELSFSLIRGGRQMSLNAELGQPKDRVFSAPMPRIQGLEDLPFGPGLRWRGEGPRMFFMDQRPRLGIQGTPLTDQMARFLGVDGKSGVLVMQVDPDSPAAAAGLLAGDVIAAVDGKAVEDLQSLREALDAGDHQLEVLREGRRLTLNVQLESPRPKGEGKSIKMD